MHSPKSVTQFGPENNKLMNEKHIPVLVGCGQITEKDVEPQDARNPLQLIVDAIRSAAEDTSRAKPLIEAIDTIAAVGLAIDAVYPPSPIAGHYANLPKSIANQLGIEASKLYYTAAGGNTPQMLVNHFAEQIAQGQTSTVLLAGGEALRTMSQIQRYQLPMDGWIDSPGGEAMSIGDQRPATSAYENEYNLFPPANTYPLFENALQVKYQRSHQEHMTRVGEIYAGLTKVAASNPYAWFQQERSADQLLTVSKDNRMIAYPYTKLLNSIIQVNQSAALILTSLAKAKELGIPEEKYVYLHGCGDAHDIWNLSERVDYCSSPALNRIGKEALQMAGKSIDEIDLFDIYSCFPSALEIACDELGIAHDDPRGLSVTGGLPYFGGPGNNYSMHAIAEMMNKLRAEPGKFGLLNANGWFVTKHAIGIYSTTPLKQTWQRKDPSSYQADILSNAGPKLVETPDGNATIETFTVLYNREGPERGFIIGRLENSHRFLADTPNDPDTLNSLLDSKTIGRKGTVSHSGGKNIFIPRG